MEKIETQLRVVAFQIAENLPLKKIKPTISEELISSSNYELFFKKADGYIYILNYGVVVFTDVPDQEKTKFLDQLRPFAGNLLPESYSENFLIQVKPQEKLSFAYNSLVVPTINDRIIRIVMLQVAQSTALDYYRDKTQEIFEETHKLIDQLETQGEIKTSRKKVLKFIGKTLNTKNRIIDDLYVIDSPASTWEEEILGIINDGLSNTFDIKTRFREVEYILKSIESSLTIFIELIESKQNKLLEIIIIGLILFEVVDLIISKFV